MAKPSKHVSVKKCRALADRIAAALKCEPELANVSAAAEIMLYLEMAAALLSNAQTGRADQIWSGKRRPGSLNQRRNQRRSSVD
jgi:hypothetical protein